MAAPSYSAIPHRATGPIPFLPEAPIRTLIVDDSSMFLEVVHGVLEFEPLVDVIAKAADGSEAIELVGKLSPDLVVMDICMRPMSGLAAAAVISWLFPKTRVVLMSSEDDPEFRLACRRVGAAAFVPKAAFATEFAQALNRLCFET